MSPFIIYYGDIVSIQIDKLFLSLTLCCQGRSIVVLVVVVVVVCAVLHFARSIFLADSIEFDRSIVLTFIIFNLYDLYLSTHSHWSHNIIVLLLVLSSTRRSRIYLSFSFSFDTLLVDLRRTFFKQQIDRLKFKLKLTFVLINLPTSIFGHNNNGVYMYKGLIYRINE